MKTYCKVVVIKTVWSWHNKRHVDNGNLINPHTYGQIIFDKDAKTGNGQLVLGKQALKALKNEVGSLPHTIFKN